MMVLVSYDVSTKTPAGKRRLQRAALKHRLEETCDPKEDSLRYYFLGSNWQRRVEHVGAKVVPDLEGPLLV